MFVLYLSMPLNILPWHKKACLINLYVLHKIEINLQVSYAAIICSLGKDIFAKRIDINICMHWGTFGPLSVDWHYIQPVKLLCRSHIYAVGSVFLAMKEWPTPWLWPGCVGLKLSVLPTPEWPTPGPIPTPFCWTLTSFLV